MLTALYYPHVNISAELFKNALFLWDKIEYIAPNEWFQPSYVDGELGEAIRSYAERHVPSPEEREQADEAILDLLQRPLPAWFYVEDVPEELRYTIYPAKFNPETWRKHTSEKLAQSIGDGYETSAPLGLTMMSLLADCCAGSQKRLVTDEAPSYSALDRYLATIGGAELGQFDKNSERLVTICLRIMNFRNVPLARLVELRDKERVAGGAHLTTLRHGYLKRVEEYGEKLCHRRIRAAIICALIFLVVYIGLFIFVRKIEIPSRDTAVQITVGFERTEFAKANFSGESDWEILRERGTDEEQLWRLWTPRSIVISRLSLYTAYCIVLLSLVAAFSWGVLSEVEKTATHT